jgi:hypothetical protein
MVALYLIFFLSNLSLAQDSRFEFSNLTVKDAVTGVIWARNANLFGRAVNYKDALNFIKKLNKQTYAGHSDWRLPNREEFRSLINYANGLGTTTNIHELFHKMGFKNIIDDPGYWTASEFTFSQPNDSAWTIAMYNGSTMYLGKIGRLFVWPVRGATVVADPMAQGGFREVAWGANIDKFPGILRLAGEDSREGVLLYKKEGDDLWLFGYPLRSIVYGFWNNKFMSVRIEMLEQRNWVAVCEAQLKMLGEEPSLSNMIFFTRWIEFTEVAGGYDMDNLAGYMELASHKMLTEWAAAREQMKKQLR